MTKDQEDRIRELHRINSIGGCSECWKQPWPCRTLEVLNAPPVSSELAK